MSGGHARRWNGRRVRKVGTLLVVPLLVLTCTWSAALAATFQYKNGWASQGDWTWSGARTSSKNTALVRNPAMTAQVSNGSYTATAAFAVTQTYSRDRYSTRCRWTNPAYASKKFVIECTVS